MNDFFKISEKKNNELEAEEISSNNKILRIYIEEAKRIIEESKVTECELHPIFSFIKLITDWLTLETAMISYLNPHPSTSGLLETIFEGKNSEYSDEKICHILTRNPKGESKVFYQKQGYKLFEYDMTVSLSDSPIVLNPWKMERLSNALMNIAVNKNEFDRKKGEYNLLNKYYYPIGVVVCNGGNHSQYSAKMKGKGVTSIKEIVNIEKLYENVEFNGEYFRFRFNNIRDSIRPKKEYVTNQKELYAGILFEIGRLLKDHANLFPRDIQRALNNSSIIR